MTGLRRTTAICLFAATAVLLPGGCESGEHSASQADERNPQLGVAFDQKLDAAVPLSLGFRDERGDVVQLGEYFDRRRPVILNLVYFACPMLCNMTTDGLVRGVNGLSLEIGDDFTVLTVSFDARENPKQAAAAKAKLLERCSRDGAAAGWCFLTGDSDAIERLTDAVGFAFRFDVERDQFAHAAGIVVLTPDGRVSRYLPGVDYSPRDLRLSLVEASEGRVGSPTDQVLLLCFQYDPTTGRYGLAIVRLLQVLGGMSVVALAVTVGRMLLRERRNDDKESAVAPNAVATTADPPQGTSGLHT
jgi:protein SCO1/2